MRIIFMGTPTFALPALRAVHETHTIVAIYTQPPRPSGRGQKETPSPVHQYATQHNLPIFNPTSLKTSEAQEQFRALKADIAVVVAYGLLLPKAILEGTRLGCINIHPSALPRWRGAAPIQRTIMAGDKTTDICIMQMDEGLDTGNVLLRKTYDIPAGTTAGELHDQLAKEAPALLLQALSSFPATPTPQATEGITYANKITKEEARLDFNQPAEAVLQKILGLSPSPGAWFEHKGERIKIFSCHASDGWHPRPSSSERPDMDIGQNVIFGRDDNGKLYLQCNPGILYPTLLQRPGGKRLAVAEFLAGFQGKT